VAVSRLVLIRHGEAQAYLDQVVAGEKGCRGLSDLGRRQATALHHRLARSGELADATALYASVLPRAIETASIIAPAVGGHDIEQDCDLCELHPGDADGMQWEDYRATYAVEPWDPARPMAPGGESWVGFVERVSGALRALVERHPDETVVVGCHGGVVITSMIVGLGLAPVGDGDHFRYGPENTSLTEWLVDDGVWRLIRYNDHAHLAEAN
jgi:broad specificity phosphatase PhoE